MKKILLLASVCVAFFAAFLSVPKHSLTTHRTDEVGQEREKGYSDALQALDFWTRSRAYPGTEIPHDKYFKEYQRDKAQFKRKPRGVSSNNIWEPIGPIDLQGRSLSVAVNPQDSNTIYVGSASGGLWRSFTQGVSHDWQQVTLGYPALGISSIVIDPLDTNVMYIGTGEVYNLDASIGGITVRTTRGSYGIGILKTTDGGQTWTKSLDWSFNQQTGIQKIIMNPHNHNSLWATTTQGLYVSRDAGATWNISDIFGLPLFIVDIVMNNLDTNKIMITIGDFSTLAAGIYYTTDGAINWNAASGPPSYSGKAMLGISQSNPNIVYASVADSTTGDGSLWRTTDFGNTWSATPDHVSLLTQGWYSHIIVVQPTNPNLLFHACVGAGYSLNAGSNFYGSSGIYSDNHGYAIDPFNPNGLYVVDDDGIYHSTDFGQTFSDIGFGMATGQFYNGFSCSNQDSLLAIGQSQDHIPGYIFTGTTNWGRSADDECGWTATNPINDNIMYVDDRNGTNIFKSIDRGNSFNYVASFSGSGSWNAPLVVNQANTAVLYFGDTKVYKSTNSGYSWAATNGNNVLDGNPAVSMAVAPTNPDTIYVGNAPIYSRARIWRSVNGGTSWTDVSATLPDRYPLDIAIDPTNSKIAYAVFAGFGSGKIYKTTDVGGSWTDITGTLPDVPTTAVAIDPLSPNIVYVGNDLSVYYSTDGGTTWNEFGDGLPDAVIVADLVISPANRALRCVTHGNGVFERALYNGTPPLAFDYKAYAFDFPASGSGIQIGSTLTGIRATFRGNGTQAQADSFSVQYRILQGSTVYYSSVKREKGLFIAESRQVSFDESFVPPDTGVYELQAISLASDLNPANDTLRGSFTVTTSPTIPYFDVTKIYLPYTEISGGSSGPVGDDVQQAFALPFPFSFDGYTYDSMQVSTNGFAEFGTGTPGSFRGLSTSGQLGGYFVSNTYMGTTDRPTKVIGPWWADMICDQTSPTNITYETIGSTPNRTFVVQWQNVRAYFDYSTTTFVNFQIRLYEQSNQIDVSYGPVNIGTYTGGGSAMGLKDALGGDYHNYDFAQMKSVVGANVITGLNPNYNWPGEDSCFRINQSVATAAVQLNQRWNLVSTPVTRSNYRVTNIFPTAIAGTTFRFDLNGGGYIQTDTLIPGQGFWTKVPDKLHMVVVGSSLPTVVLKLDAGWNLIGGLDHDVSLPNSSLFTSYLFGYDNGYNPTSTISPGYGYWIKTSDTATVLLGEILKQNAGKLPDLTAFSSITITDKNGNKQKLYVAGSKHGDVDVSKFELPPVSPSGIFDARFASNRMMERVQSQTDNIFPIHVTSASYPLTISFDNGSESFAAVVQAGDKQLTVKQGSTVKVNDANAKLSLKIIDGAGIPTAFALNQNYPNPFNPTTVISYSLPVRSHVTLKIYDMLGREVSTLVNETQDAGIQTKQLDASDLASGVYLYQIQAGDYSAVKKMVVVK